MTRTTSENENAGCNGLRTDLIRKIKLQRGIHDYYEDVTRFLLTAQKVINVIMTAFITLIVFADFGLIVAVFPKYSGQPALITVGLISFVLFVLNALADVFSLSSRHTEHLQAIQSYSNLLRDIRKVQSMAHDGATERELLHQFNDRYMQISVSSINVGGRKFEHAQGIYLRRRARRLAIQKNPYAGYFAVRKRAKEIISSGLDNDTEV